MNSNELIFSGEEKTYAKVEIKPRFFFLAEKESCVDYQCHLAKTEKENSRLFISKIDGILLGY